MKNFITHFEYLPVHSGVLLKSILMLFMLFSVVSLNATERDSLSQGKPAASKSSIIDTPIGGGGSETYTEPIKDCPYKVGDTFDSVINSTSLRYTVESVLTNTVKKYNISHDNGSTTMIPYYDVTYTVNLAVSCNLPLTEGFDDEKEYVIQYSQFNIPSTLNLTSHMTSHKQNVYTITGNVNAILAHGFEGVQVGTYYSSPFYCTSITIPSTITTVGEYAFAHNEDLKKVLLNCANLGAHAFQGCTSLSDVQLLSNVTAVSNYCFADCGELSNFLVGFSNRMTLTSIGDYAFANDSKLSSLTYQTKFLPWKATYETTNGFTPYITSIGAHAFENCSSMSSVTFNTAYSNSTAYGISSIGANAFSGTSIRVCKLPNTLQSLNLTAFDNTSVKHVSTPSYVTALTGTDNDTSSKISEVTVPFGCAASGLGTQALYCLTNSMSELPTVTSTGNPIYVKPSVYASLSSNSYNRFQKDIPVTFPNTTDEKGFAYVTLSRDFDCDFSESGKDLTAYVMYGLDGDGTTIKTQPVKYAPSRLNAQQTRNYFEDYIGVILRGKPGKTYYYHIGEKDYTQGSSQTSTNSAFGMSADALWGKGCNDEQEVSASEEDGSVNYGLSRAYYRKYKQSGWVPYNKTYLNVPSTVAAKANSVLRIEFDDENGTTTYINAAEVQGLTVNSDTYDLNGRKVDSSYKGVVIKNGKKMLQR